MKWYQKTVKEAGEPELIGEACFRIGEIAAAGGERAKARGFLRRAIRSGDETFGPQARELLERLGG